MLSGFTNYLFGAYFKSDDSSASQLTDDDDCTNSMITLEDDDDDWMLVHTSGGDESKGMSMALVPITRSPLSCVENSWYITPPSCFTAGSLSSMDMSPLENLLIEHPSMSVYNNHHHGLASSKSSHKKDEKATTTTTVVGGGAPPPPPKSTKRCVTIKEPCIGSKINQVIQNIQNETQGQKMMQWQQVKYVHMKQLERQNKVQDYQSKNQRQRRKDHSHRPSGRSNDRKC